MFKKILFILNNKLNLIFILNIIITNYFSKKIHIKNEAILKNFKQKIKNKKFNYYWFLKNIPFIVYFIDKKQNKKKILEIGSYEGLSSFFFLIIIKKVILFVLILSSNQIKSLIVKNFQLQKKILIII
jgi:hypothetical protein